MIKGQVAITDKICPIEKIRFFYVAGCLKVNSSRISPIALVAAVVRIVNDCHFYS